KQIPFARPNDHFPSSGDFGVETIDYSTPYLLLTDPCMPKRLLKGFDLSELAEISVPLRSPGWPTNYIDDILLTWEQPYCVFPPCNHCESNCQSENGDGECSRKKRGLSSGTKYAVIFIVGTPISLIAVCIIYYNIRVHCYDHLHQPNAEISSLTEEQQLADITVNGLDGSRIEAYPITLLAKETIRTIPDCNHYFHANCIDEWFKLNAACPVCRNTPDHDSARLITRSTSAFSSRPPL
ncbi:hypothetical protein Gotri_024033, partial [Gossypium trilobum]|nr:hypothetical protein [Gossypium trilobum]